MTFLSTVVAEVSAHTTISTVTAVLLSSAMVRRPRSIPVSGWTTTATASSIPFAASLLYDESLTIVAGKGPAMHVLDGVKSLASIRKNDKGIATMVLDVYGDDLTVAVESPF